MRLLHRAGADVRLSALNEQTAATVAAERGKVSAEPELSRVRQSSAVRTMPRCACDAGMYVLYLILALAARGSAAAP